MFARLVAPLVFASVLGCAPADRSVSSPDSRFRLLLRSQRLRPTTYQPPGWAELYGPFGLFCGRADFFGEASTAQVSWGPNSLTVDGASGSWTLEPCQFLPPPAPWSPRSY